MKKCAFITGISGQDGSYLAEFLLEKGYIVHGMVRRHSVAENQSERIEHLRENSYFHLHYGDVTDPVSMLKIFNHFRFDEVYNLAAQSNVGISFKMPIFTQEVNYLGFINLIECLMNSKLNNLSDNPDLRVYQASSSEMFGNEVDADGFQRETTPMTPVSPYGVSKLAAHKYAQHIRRSTGMKISCGILFNHESPRRGTNFVTGKVAKGVAEIALGIKDTLYLGNLDSCRDWGHSKDYVKVMWQMLNECEPDDFICCTGITRSIHNLCQLAFSSVGLNYEDHVKIDSFHFRSEELDYLRGCSDKLNSKIKIDLSYSFSQMIEEMIQYHKDKLTHEKAGRTR
jgi:GDPmannose 4,6-dehydratase